MDINAIKELVQTVDIVPIVSQEEREQMITDYIMIGGYTEEEAIIATNETVKTELNLN